jgi:16S rRNA (cytosine1402-N4)-methyltransferase
MSPPSGLTVRGPAPWTYRQPLGQPAGGPLLQPPSLMHPERKPGAVPAEGLPMSPSMTGRPLFAHKAVMLAEVVELLRVVPAGVLLDATVGGGGHAAAVLDAAPQLELVGIDRDEEALQAATEALARFPGRAVLSWARFDQLREVLDALGKGSISGALFDLGVSSPQLDTPERGFSYRFDAALDMRMDRSQDLTAAELLRQLSEEDLVRLLKLHGEERFARRIAAAVLTARPTTTRALAEVVASAVPVAARRRGHPAKRVFQALRAAVNGELEAIPAALDAAIERLAPGGRVVVISYHSGEDRLVKERLLAAATGGCTCPPGLPCTCGAVPKLRLLNRGARKPGAAEVALNPRAASARLRAGERLP